MRISKYDLIAYASAFASFIIPKIEVSEIILFGSVARGEASKDSDVDLFVNVKNKERETQKIIDNEINKFYKSNIAETWALKGIKNKINIHVGELEKWKLKRSIISEGVVLYGKYRETPKDVKGFSYFKIEPIKNIARRNLILRKLFGRKEKSYSTKGIIDVMNGKKLSSLSFIVPLEKLQEIIGILNSNKINYSFFEFWSDQIEK